jgi:hypothetical protein
MQSNIFFTDQNMNGGDFMGLNDNMNSRDLDEAQNKFMHFILQT